NSLVAVRSTGICSAAKKFRSSGCAPRCLRRSGLIFVQSSILGLPAQLEVRALTLADSASCTTLSQCTNSVKLLVMDKVIYTEREMALIDPKPGSAAAAARESGIDLSLTVSNLRLTPEERIRNLDSQVDGIRELRR